MSYPDANSARWLSRFAKRIKDEACKSLESLGLSDDHKILGLILDRPQDVAVMSLPHEEVRGRLVVQFESTRKGASRTGKERAQRRFGAFSHAQRNPQGPHRSWNSKSFLT